MRYLARKLRDLADRLEYKKLTPVDYSLKKGDVVYEKTWRLTTLEIVDVNWALKAAAVRLGPTGGIVVWPVAGLSREPI